MKSSILLLLALTLIQCRKTEGITDLGFAYFPIEVGRQWVYQVDSLLYSDFSNKVDSVRSYMLVSIDSSHIDGEGDELFRVEYFWRRSTGQAWSAHHISWIKRTANGVERINNDMREVLMVFPVNDFTYWDRNSHNTSEQKRVRYIHMGDPIQLDSISSGNTVEVEWPEDVNPYFHTLGREVYGWGIGLLLEEYRDTETQNGRTKGYAFRKELQWTSG